MMKLMVVKDDVHLGCIEMTDNGLVIKKYKPEFEVEVEDAPDEDDHDDAYDGYDKDVIEEDDEEMKKQDEEDDLEKKFDAKADSEKVKEKKLTFDLADEEEEGEEDSRLPKKQKRPGRSF